MRALLPENGVTTFKKEMDRLFDRFWEGNETQGTWEPRLDVYETKEAFLHTRGLCNHHARPVEDFDATFSF